MKRIQRVFGNIDAHQFVDNWLDDERRSNFMAHLADHPEEAERVQTWSRQNDAIRGAFAGVAAEPIPVWLRLDTMLAERAPRAFDTAPARRAEPPRLVTHPTLAKPVPPEVGRGRLLGNAVAVFAAVALVSLLAVRTLTPWSLSDEPRVQPTADLHRALMSRGTEAYMTFAVDPQHPVEVVASDDGSLGRWIQRRLSVPARAPDLEPQGWSLLGGRLAPGDREPGAFYVYQNGSNERMGLYIARTDASSKSGLSLQSFPGGSVMSWVSGPIGYVVTVGRNSAWLAQHAEFIKDGIDPAIPD